MGLFSDVLHLWQGDRERVVSALIKSLESAGYVTRVSPISPPPALAPAVAQPAPHNKWQVRAKSTAPPPHPTPERDELLYFVTPQNGNWTIVVQAHALPQPRLSYVAAMLSESLDTYALTLNLHDDDVLFYNLYRSGRELDGYNSAPQYFEQKPLSEAAIKSQRHDPLAFSPLLPGGASLEHVREILDKGWWAAHDARRLDEHGLAPDDEPAFAGEEERMVALANLLQLHGATAGYPYTAWYRSTKIDWASLIAIRASHVGDNTSRS